ncbi:hypothetical protein CCHR01_08835 [Colletotrichum chrysophilum]|uniref:Uncharacterized protein n=1 Tax=Colletotrichum chrysophilum TaxID=1836956 RepID=A0AAD9EL16_9PEZI|nr:hypothetical protein CCHR01_08835 [Colletotrichum chrysophilum]
MTDVGQALRTSETVRHQPSSAQADSFKKICDVCIRQADHQPLLSPMLPQTDAMEPTSSHVTAGLDDGYSALIHASHPNLPQSTWLGQYFTGEKRLWPEVHHGSRRSPKSARKQPHNTTASFRDAYLQRTRHTAYSSPVLMSCCYSKIRQ